MTDTSYVQTIVENNNKARELVRKYKVLVVGLSWSQNFADIVSAVKKAYPEAHIIEFDQVDDKLQRLEMQKSFMNITDHCVVPAVFVSGKDISDSENIWQLAKDGKLTKTVQAALA